MNRSCKYDSPSFDLIILSSLYYSDRSMKLLWLVILPRKATTSSIEGKAPLQQVLWRRSGSEFAARTYLLQRVCRSVNLIEHFTSLLPAEECMLSYCARFVKNTIPYLFLLLPTASAALPAVSSVNVSPQKMITSSLPLSKAVPPPFLNSWRFRFPLHAFVYCRTRTPLPLDLKNYSTSSDGRG